MYHFHKSFQSLGIKSLVYQKIPKSNSFACVCYCCYRAAIKIVLNFSTIVQPISVFGQLNWQLSGSFFLFVKTNTLSVENIQPENSIFKCAYIAMISDIDTAFDKQRNTSYRLFYAVLLRFILELYQSQQSIFNVNFI